MDATQNMGTHDDWPETLRAFRRIAAVAGIRRIAEEVPANPCTIYRLIGGVTHTPTRAIRAGIERIAREHKKDESTP